MTPSYLERAPNRQRTLRLIGVIVIIDAIVLQIATATIVDEATSSTGGPPPSLPPPRSPCAQLPLALLFVAQLLDGTDIAPHHFGGHLRSARSSARPATRGHSIAGPRHLLPPVHRLLTVAVVVGGSGTDRARLLMIVAGEGGGAGRGPARPPLPIDARPATRENSFTAFASTFVASKTIARPLRVNLLPNQLELESLMQPPASIRSDPIPFAWKAVPERARARPTRARGHHNT
uniref:Uncharacterized protein n=1 Tax=Anopheles atroparvus TaxID=41427 RepID=A0A182JEX1_ANOAO